jgi:exosome complex RNA-binding protein Rrp4
MKDQNKNELIIKISEGLKQSTKKMFETKRKLGQKIVISQNGKIIITNP